MPVLQQDMLEALSTLELAEQEKQQGGSPYAVRQAARSALELVQKAASGDALCSEIRQRANRLLEHGGGQA